MLCKRTKTIRTAMPSNRGYIHMNRTVLITITAIAAAFLQPFQAYARGGGGGGGHFEGGGNFGSAAHFGGGAGRSTGGWSVRAPQAPAFFAPSVQQSPRVFSQGQAFTRTAPVITNRTLVGSSAKMLALHEPEKIQWTPDWAYATRRCDSIDAARLILLEALERIPTAAILHYGFGVLRVSAWRCRGGQEQVEARVQTGARTEREGAGS